MLIGIALLILIYFVPGFFLSRLFKGKLKRNPFFCLLLSLLIVPIFYTLLTSLKILSRESFLLLNTTYALLCLLINKKLKSNERPNLDKLFPSAKTHFSFLLLAAVFFLLVMAPRLGLWKGHFPNGDDFRHLQKVVSVAVSPNEPLFHYFPITRLTIYYFSNISPGLLVKFSDNVVQAHKAWFIHTALYTALILWLIIRIGYALFKTKIARFIFLFSLTYFSGLEYYLYQLKGPKGLDQLGWWTDWFLPQSQIHLQTTNPYNLFFWVPQHLMAAVLVLIMFMLLKSNEKDKLPGKVFLALIWANILGLSAFVFLPTAIVYGIYMIAEIVKKGNVRETLKFNIPMVITSIAFSSKTIELFLTAEKSRHFVQMANVFWFLPNSTFLGKLVNFSLTIPLYFLIELGILLPVLLWSLYQFIKDKTFRQKYLFFYLFIFFWPVIFVIKTIGDNNISLRAFIPAQLALGLFAAEWAEVVQKKSRLFYALVTAGIIISLPSGLWDFGRRFEGQPALFKKERGVFYQTIDEKLPLTSIVLTPPGGAENMTVLGHRFTFKPLPEFTFTDREYSPRSDIQPYADLDFSEEKDILKVVRENPQLLEIFDFYTIRGDSVYPLEIKVHHE